MASTITAATLTITITESVTLNGSDQGATNSITVDNVDEVVKRIVSVPTSESGLLGFDSTDIFSTGYLAGQFVEGNVRYIRITNKDDANHVTLKFRGNDTTDAEFAVMLDKGHSYIVSCDQDLGTVGTVDAGDAPLSPTLLNLIDITAVADT
ncbi:MAG: hypothetical protein JRE18_07295, partial [Deltaproteobacteria bacterium]|nr:hypothetical protein [Deltaproteobacteria bacterium]